MTANGPLTTPELVAIFDEAAEEVRRSRAEDPDYHRTVQAQTQEMGLQKAVAELHALLAAPPG